MSSRSRSEYTRNLLLAHTARSKLLGYAESSERKQTECSLRVLVGHGNLLDKLMYYLNENSPPVLDFSDDDDDSEEISEPLVTFTETVLSLSDEDDYSEEDESDEYDAAPSYTFNRVSVVDVKDDYYGEVIPLTLNSSNTLEQAPDNRLSDECIPRYVPGIGEASVPRLQLSYNEETRATEDIVQ